MIDICIIDESVVIYKLLDYPIPINNGKEYVYDTPHVVEYSKPYNQFLKKLRPFNHHLIFYVAYSIVNPAHNVTLSPKVIILAEDKKRKDGSYWRHDYLPTYKEGRHPTKPLAFYLLRDAFRQLAEKFSFMYVVSQSSFEADDIAGYYRKHLDCSLCFVTVDSDWYQLLSHEEDVIIDPIRYPQILTSNMALAKYQKRYPNDCIFSLHEIVEHKAIKGDISDNIPPNSDEGIIDLINPTVSPKNLFIPHDTKVCHDEYSKLVKMAERLTEQGIYLWS